jgi:hypothetical protein
MVVGAARCNLRAQQSSAPALFIRGCGLIQACVAQDPKAPLLVGHVDIAARIHQHVLCLGYEVARSDVRSGEQVARRLNKNHGSATMNGLAEGWPPLLIAEVRTMLTRSQTDPARRRISGLRTKQLARAPCLAFDPLLGNSLTSRTIGNASGVSGLEECEAVVFPLPSSRE